VQNPEDSSAVEVKRGRKPAKNIKDTVKTEEVVKKKPGRQKKKALQEMKEEV
jgi:hypothetical protein